MQQQTPRSLWIVVEPVGIIVRSDVGIHQPGFPTVRLDVGLGQANLASPDGFDLAPLQSNPCFEVFQQEIFEFCLSISGNYFDTHGMDFSIYFEGKLKHMEIISMRNFKDDFLLDPDVIFLNHGSFGATPKPVFAEYQRWQLELERQPVEFLGRRYCDLLSRARLKLAEYFHADQDDLVYVTNATMGINIVARSLDLRPGDEVLASDHEYGAADRIWRFLAEKQGFRYINQEIPVPVQSSQQVLDALLAGVTSRTRVIFVSHYTSPTALIFPVEEFCRRARHLGILTVIDGAHTPGQVEVNLSNIGADFYIGNLHKWLCAPKGSAFLYARPEAQDLIQPLIVSWGWQSEQPGKSRFIDYLEWFGTHDPAACLAVPAAIQYQIENGWDEVRTECHTLAADARRRVSGITGLPELSPDDPAWYRQMVAVQLPDWIRPDQLKAALLDIYKIEIPIIRWKNLNLLRISVQAYNTQTDIIALEQALIQLLKPDQAVQ